MNSWNDILDLKGFKLLLNRTLSLLFLMIICSACTIGGGDNSGVGTEIVNAQNQVFRDPALMNTQLDRIGKPGVNTLLINSSLKDRFNEGEPLEDFRFKEEVTQNLIALGGGNTNSEFLVGALIPDVLIIDTNVPSDYAALNGRKLIDDVIDISLKLLTGNPSASDHVDGNDLPLTPEFPYLARPH